MGRFSLSLLNGSLYLQDTWTSLRWFNWILLPWNSVGLWLEPFLYCLMKDFWWCFLACLCLRSCYDAFTENMAGESQLLEKRRQYHCAAYNCAIAVISCVFTESKFYQGFLFSEKSEKVRSFCCCLKASRAWDTKWFYLMAINQRMKPEWHAIILTNYPVRQ